MPGSHSAVTWIIGQRATSQGESGAAVLLAYALAHVMAVHPYPLTGTWRRLPIPGSMRNASKTAVSFVTAMPGVLQMNRLHSQELSSNLLPFSPEK
jgi:hypothetical protein